MTFRNLYLVGIIVEPTLKDNILDIIQKSGAHEYTFYSVNGEGTTTIHGMDWEGEFIKFESIVAEAVASDIFQQIKERFLKNYALIIYKHPVEVIRSEKF